MAVQNIYTDTGFDQSMDVSASTRKFQISVIVTQDAGKSGILSYLEPPVSIAAGSESYQTLSQIPERPASDY